MNGSIKAINEDTQKRQQSQNTRAWLFKPNDAVSERFVKISKAI